MISYEYTRLIFDYGDLSELNSMGSVGWRVVSVQFIGNPHYEWWALLERPLSLV